MNNKSAKPAGLWSREPPRRISPKRGAGGFYRTAEGDGAGLGGVPLSAAEDAVVLIPGDLPSELHAKARRAEGNCPERAITIQD